MSFSDTQLLQNLRLTAEGLTVVAVHENSPQLLATGIDEMCTRLVVVSGSCDNSIGLGWRSLSLPFVLLNRGSWVQMGLAHSSSWAFGSALHLLLRGQEVLAHHQLARGEPAAWHLQFR